MSIVFGSLRLATCYFDVVAAWSVYATVDCRSPANFVTVIVVNDPLEPPCYRYCALFTAHRQHRDNAFGRCVDLGCFNGSLNNKPASLLARLSHRDTVFPVPPLCVVPSAFKSRNLRAPPCDTAAMKHSLAPVLNSSTPA